MKPRIFLEKFEILAGTPDSIPALRQTILQLAIQGRLVSQDPKDEAAAALLARATGGNAWKLNDAPVGLPAGWAWARLGGLGEFLGGGTPSKANSAFWEGDIPWVSPKDMKVRYISDAIDHISEAAIENSAAGMIPTGSALMVVRGMILIHSFPVALTRREVAINQDMKALSLSEPAMGDYLIRALAGLRDNMLAVVERSSHGTCRIESAKLKAFPIPVPPLAEQKRIVAKVEQLLTLCDELETRLKDAAVRRERLLAAAIRDILAEATPL